MSAANCRKRSRRLREFKSHRRLCFITPTPSIYTHTQLVVVQSPGVTSQLPAEEQGSVSDIIRMLLESTVELQRRSQIATKVSQSENCGFILLYHQPAVSVAQSCTCPDMSPAKRNRLGLRRRGACLKKEGNLFSQRWENY